METVFPKDTGYAGFFLVGFRKIPPDPPNETQRVGTVVLKRTYEIQFPVGSTLNGTLSPSEELLPVFNMDQPDMDEQSGNLAINGDFEALENGELANWLAQSGAQISQVVDTEIEDNHLMQVTGDAVRRITQVISFPAPLGGHKFALLFAAKAENAPNVSAQLEAGASTICAITKTLDPTMNTYVARGQWSDNVTATEMTVVVESADSAGQTVFYDDVTVFSLIHFEHDLVPFKPEGDLVVPDFVDITGECSLRVDGQLRLRRTLAGDEFNLFGWASRSEEDPGAPESRSDQDGSFSKVPDDYPPEWPPSVPGKDPLPDNFDNRFYNGYDRAAADAAGLSQLPYLTQADFVQIIRPGLSDDYSFSLGSETIGAHYEFYSGTGPDKECYWQPQSVDMNLDTLVIEPQINRCYAVWRGVWDYDDHPEDSYRRLVVTAT